MSLTRTSASAAVEHIGWRLLLGFFVSCVPVSSLAEAHSVAAAALTAAGDDADEHLRIDLRPGRVEFVVQTASMGWVNEQDVAVCEAISAALSGRTVPMAEPRPVQMLEIAIDAIDIQAVAPFWAAIFGYVEERTDEGDIAAVVDPLGQGPAVWFQQMDVPRPQRNRIHFDITVPHDQAEARVAAAIAAGGHLVSDRAARSFWILADAEGNEVCVCTWQDREKTD